MPRIQPSSVSHLVNCLSVSLSCKRRCALFQDTLCVCWVNAPSCALLVNVSASRKRKAQSCLGHLLCQSCHPGVSCHQDWYPAPHVCVFLYHLPSNCSKQGVDKGDGRAGLLLCPGCSRLAAYGSSVPFHLCFHTPPFTQIQMVSSFHLFSISCLWRKACLGLQFQNFLKYFHVFQTKHLRENKGRSEAFLAGISLLRKNEQAHKWMGEGMTDSGRKAFYFNLFYSIIMMIIIILALMLAQPWPWVEIPWVQIFLGGTVGR